MLYGNARQLTLEHMRVFVAVIETKSFSKAGEELGKSQPAIHVGIAQQLALDFYLEHDLQSTVGGRNGDVPSQTTVRLVPYAA